MTINPNPRLGAEITGPSDALLGDELLAASHRMAMNRARGARALGRSRARRRILPSIVVTSMALVGAGVANAFVSSTLIPTTSTAPSSSSLAASGQDAANALTLKRLSTVIATDQRTLAALTASAARTSAAAGGVPTNSASGSGQGPVSVVAPVITASVPAPTTHATTGASGVG